MLNRFCAGVFFTLAVTLASAIATDASAPKIFNVAVPGSPTPPGQEQQSDTYLVINLNPLASETIVVNKTTTNSQSSSAASAAPKSSSVGAPAHDVTTTTCVNTPSLAACTAAVGALIDALNAELAPFTGQSATSVTATAAGYVEQELRTFKTGGVPDAYPAISSATNFADAISDYQAFLSVADFTSALTYLDPFKTDSVAKKKQTFTQTYGEISAISKSIPNNAGLTASLATAESLITSLGSTTVTPIETAADAMVTTLQNAKTDGSAFYAFVPATCERDGFNANKYTVKFNRGTATVWENDVTCFAEFSVGAMYYVDWLDPTTYTLNAAKMPIAQQNNRNQGSVAALFNDCPGEGPQTLCGTVAASSGTNGLDVFLGGAYLFAQRVVGFNAGAHVGQINVLTNGYTLNTVVPSGATYTRKQISANLYVGLTLNLNK